MRFAARTDSNHVGIVNTLRNLGCEVLSLAAVGNGCPDLLVYRGGKLFMLEIKDGSKIPSQRKLTRHQKQFHQRWPVRVVTSQEEAIAAISEAGKRAGS